MDSSHFPVASCRICTLLLACVLCRTDLCYNKCLKSTLIPVGLDAAGKTTILYKLKLGEIVTTIPTIGKSLRSFNQQTNKRHLLKNRLQCGDGGIQEHLLHRVGCRRPGQDQATLAALLPKHPGM